MNYSDFIGMQVLYGIYDLRHEVSHFDVWEALVAFFCTVLKSLEGSLIDQVLERFVGAELHENVDVGFVFEEMFEFNDVLVF